MNPVATAPKTVSTPYGTAFLADDGTKLAHVIGVGVDQGAPPLRNETLGQNLESVVKRFPDREAIVDLYADVRMSYREFFHKVQAVASAMVRAGYSKGDRVGIWATNRWEWIVVEYACHYLGIVLVNINPAYRQTELNYVLEKVGVKGVFAARRYKDSDYRTMLLEASKQRGINLSDVVYFGSERWNELLDGGIDDLSAHTADLDPDDPINIQFTSGTTGFPKGATLSHKNILNNAYFTGEILGYTEDDRVCIPLPFFHTFGMGLGIIGTMARGGTVIIASPTFKARETLMAVHSARATALYGVPTMFIACLEEMHDQAEYGSPYDLSSLRTGIMGGASCPTKTMNEVMEKMNMTEVTICFGMTETSPTSTQTRRNSPTERRTTTVGQVSPHVELRVVNPETEEVLGRNESGEIQVRGYSVMKGYWNHPEKTAEAINDDGWMRTGDIGQMDDEGYVTVTGRMKDMLIRGGENIYPREIEEFLYTHPDVVDVQVIGVPDDRYGEEVMAWFILHDGAESLTVDDVAEFCHGKLARQKVPRYVHCVDSFPLTSSGKVRKVDLREMAPKVLGWV
ncbi:AMP-binding protein [Corynebacterium sp. H78]|uniref:AMP-binding protein n=1 Tax=Corynebacterium sp. H78 TaxID=3133417 RepID=UPI0030A1FC28